MNLLSSGVDTQLGISAQDGDRANASWASQYSCGAQLFVPWTQSLMNAPDMLGEARVTGENALTTNSRETMNGTGQPGDLLESPTATALKEVNVGGSEFSCSSVGSGPAPPIPNRPTSSSGMSLEGEARAIQTDETTPPSMPTFA